MPTGTSLTLIKAATSGHSEEWDRFVGSAKLRCWRRRNVRSMEGRRQPEVRIEGLRVHERHRTNRTSRSDGLKEESPASRGSRLAIVLLGPRAGGGHASGLMRGGMPRGIEGGYGPHRDSDHRGGPIVASSRAPVPVSPAGQSSHMLTWPPPPGARLAPVTERVHGAHVRDGRGCAACRMPGLVSE
jgi:hypothetical protein